jgi:hypothetical protein
VLCLLEYLVQLRNIPSMHNYTAYCPECFFICKVLPCHSEAILVRPVKLVDCIAQQTGIIVYYLGRRRLKQERRHAFCLTRHGESPSSALQSQTSTATWLLTVLLLQLQQPASSIFFPTGHSVLSRLKYSTALVLSSLAPHTLTNS